MQSTDLNLLPVLLALLEEENVTRAAARLNLSVPAASRALDRARRMFGDPLLVRSGRGVVMTPRGRTLLPELLAVLDTVASVVERPGALPPDRIRRRFSIRANEAVIAAAGAELIAIASRLPPRVVFLSMNDSDAYRAAARELGAYGYVGKGDFVMNLIPLIDRLVAEMAGSTALIVGTESQIV